MSFLSGMGNAIRESIPKQNLMHKAIGGGVVGAAVGAYRDDTGVIEGALKGAAINVAGSLQGKLTAPGMGAFFGGAYGAFSDNLSVQAGMLGGAAIGGIGSQVPRAVGYVKARFNPVAAEAGEAAATAAGGGVSAATQDANAHNASRAANAAANNVGI